MHSFALLPRGDDSVIGISGENVADAIAAALQQHLHDVDIYQDGAYLVTLWREDPKEPAWMI